MTKTILTVLFVFSGILLKAQPNQGSLRKIWNNESLADTVRSNAINELIQTFYSTRQVDSIHIYADKYYSFSKSKNFKLGIGKSLSTKGFIYQMQSNLTESLSCFNRALTAYEDIDNAEGMAWCAQAIGTNYSLRGNNKKAIEYYQLSLKYSEQNAEPRTQAGVYMHIARIYQEQGDTDMAREYSEKALHIGLETNDPMILTNCYGALGVIYGILGDQTKALDYTQKGLVLAIENSDITAQVQFMAAAGEVYYANKQYEKATESLLGMLQIAKDIRDEISEAKGEVTLGLAYLKLDNKENALERCKYGLDLAERIGNIGIQKNACQCLYDTYKALGNSNKALEYNELLNAIDDSLASQETAKKLQQMEFDKQVLADSLATAKKASLIKEAHKEEVRQKNQTRNALAVGGMIVLLLAGGLYGRVRYIRKSKAMLQKEKDRSENLLLNILPADIAEELKTHGKAEARDFDMVSILFTDFKGFTEASSKMSASMLVSEINVYFKAFDGIMDKYNIEKIKTIGDAYMAAGGLPVPTNDSVKNTVLAALEMQAYISKRKVELDALGQPAFEMRVGIHTGPVVAGIVGVKKFQYDIWGDTVNTASRMESNGDVGKVNISQATCELLKSDSDFTFESRGKVQAKGKGEIEMWFVSKT